MLAFATFSTFASPEEEEEEEEEGDDDDEGAVALPGIDFACLGFGRPGPPGADDGAESHLGGGFLEPPVALPATVSSSCGTARAFSSTCARLLTRGTCTTTRHEQKLKQTTIERERGRGSVGAFIALQVETPRCTMPSLHARTIAKNT